MAMFKPTYGQIIDKVNSESEDGEDIISSRYSVVVATAKRARQIVDGSLPLVEDHDDKPLSLAVQEIFKGEVKVNKPGKTE